jgi:hypothetical protein
MQTTQGADEAVLEGLRQDEARLRVQISALAHLRSALLSVLGTLQHMVCRVPPPVRAPLHADPPWARIHVMGRSIIPYAHMSHPGSALGARPLYRLKEVCDAIDPSLVPYNESRGVPTYPIVASHADGTASRPVKCVDIAGVVRVVSKHRPGTSQGRHLVRAC